MNIATLLARSGKLVPTLPALKMGRGAVTSYRAFADSAAARAGALQNDFHCAPGSAIAVLANNCPAYLEALYAIWWAGCIAVPINAKLHPREAMFILADANISACFVSPAWAAALAGYAHEHTGQKPPLIALDTTEFAAMALNPPLPIAARDPHDTAWLFYTSGTTGKPKGAMLTHHNLLAMTLNYFSDVDGIEFGDAILHAAPISHGSGLYNFAHVLRGAAQIFPVSESFDPAEIIGVLQQHRGVSMFAAPTMVKRLADYVERESANTTNLKTIIYGGAPMYTADLARAMHIFGNKLVQIYGQGESPMTITTLSKHHHADVAHPRHAARLASVGVAHSGVQIRVVDGAGNHAPIGEICVKGDTVMRGYWNNPDATANALQEGWLWTGDIGSIDADGFLTLVDRSKDLVISGGANIYPREIEEVLMQHESVAEVAVIGRADPEWGEIVLAFIVVKPGHATDAAQLDQHCLKHIARFKRPKQYRFIESLPKNNYGKVLKTALREMR